MTYEWDPAKAIENLRKHRVDFRDAIGALEDPNRIEEIDDLEVDSEERRRIIGMSSARVLFVATTRRGVANCRIISARKATRDEQDRYFAGDRDVW